MRAVVRRESVRKRLEQIEYTLALWIAEVQRMRYGAGQEGSEKVVNAFSVEECGEVREDVGGGNAQRNHWQRHDGSRRVWTNHVGLGEDGDVRAVSRKNNVVNGEQRHATSCGRRNVAGIDREHMRWHVRGQIIHHRGEFLGEDVRGRVGLDACKDLKHARRANKPWRLWLTASWTY